MKKREEKIVSQSTLVKLLIILSIFWIIVLGIVLLGISEISLKIIAYVLGGVFLAVILALITIAAMARLMGWKI